MTKIFICHSSEDKPVARRIASDLKGLGVESWLDEFELDVGDSLIAKISDGIRDCEFVLALISNNSVASNWVQKELQMAMTREVTKGAISVLPAIIDDCRNSLPYYLIDKLYADFTIADSYRSQLERIVRSIARKSNNRPTRLGALHASQSNVGELNVGDVVHDRGKDFRVYRTIAKYRHGGIEHLLMGLTVLFLALFLKYFGPDHVAPSAFMLGVVGSLWGLAGISLFAATTFYLAAFDSDRNIIVQLEGIKAPRYVLTRTWFREYNVGKHVRSFRIGMFLEALTFVLLPLGAIIALAALVMMLE